MYVIGRNVFKNLVKILSKDTYEIYVRKNLLPTDVWISKVKTVAKETRRQ